MLPKARVSLQANIRNAAAQPLLPWLACLAQRPLDLTHADASFVGAGADGCMRALR